MVTCMLMGLLYFLPTILAVRRGHPGGGIFTLNLLLGWTVIGWLAMLVWSLTLPGEYGAEWYGQQYSAGYYGPRYYDPRYGGRFSSCASPYRPGTLYCRTCWRRWW